MQMPMLLSELPTGFRFHPTDQELVVNYLQTRAAGQPCPVPIVADLDIYKYDPWHLPSMALFGDREWYFFTPRDRKYPNGLRPNRSAASGFWKATGTDKLISLHDGLPIAIKKALVFYVGRPPTGTKTPWVMHEYRLLDPATTTTSSSSSMRLDEWVLCRIFSKTGPPSPGTDSQIQHLQDLLSPTNIMYAPPPPPPLVPTSVMVHNNNSNLDYHPCTDDVSDMYSGVLLAIQEEAAPVNPLDDLPALIYHCECHQNEITGGEVEAISEITGGKGEGEAISEADTVATTAATDRQEGDSNCATTDSEQQIDSMLMGQAFFATHK